MLLSLLLLNLLLLLLLVHVVQVQVQAGGRRRTLRARHKSTVWVSPAHRVHPLELDVSTGDDDAATGGGGVRDGAAGHRHHTVVRGGRGQRAARPVLGRFQPHRRGIPTDCVFDQLLRVVDFIFVGTGNLHKTFLCTWIDFAGISVADDNLVLAVRLAGDLGRLRELARGADQLAGRQRRNDLLLCAERHSGRGGAQQRGWIVGLNIGGLMLVVRVRAVGNLPRFGPQLNQFEQVQPGHDVEPFVLGRVAEDDERPVERVLRDQLELGTVQAQVRQQCVHTVGVVAAVVQAGGHILRQRDEFLDRLNLVHRNVDVRLLQRGLERTRRLQILDGRTAHLRHGCCRTMAAITTINYSRLHNLHSNDDATRLTDCQSLHRSSLWASKIMIDSIFAKSLPAGFHVSSRSWKTLHTHTNARGHPQHTHSQSLPHVETGRRRLMLLMMLLVTKQKENKRISADVCAPPLFFSALLCAAPTFLNAIKLSNENVCGGGVPSSLSVGRLVVRCFRGAISLEVQ
uniref:(northern house mosquito) hypothetical protein n=1 Tax=Culex pipiens TaxID=7175 RepID=A0A8D8NR31_CULPI